MNSETKKKLNANIKAVNRDLIMIYEDKLPTNELIKIQFEAIKELISDCERLVLEK